MKGYSVVPTLPPDPMAHSQSSQTCLYQLLQAMRFATCPVKRSDYQQYYSIIIRHRHTRDFSSTMHMVVMNSSTQRPVDL